MKDLVVDKIDGEISIFSIDDSTLYSFNKSGSDIFEMIKKGQNKKTIAKIMSKKYDISEKKAEKDVDDFLRNLSKNKIISISEQKKVNI